MQGPTQPIYVRRRAVALGVAVGLLFVLVALARGDGSSPFGAKLDVSLSPAEQAKLPWRQRYVSGSAGPLDGRGLPALPAQRAAVQRLHRLGLPVYCGGGRGNYAALTFDDGPSEYTEQVMQQLRAAGAQATFFLVGEVIGERSDLPRQLLDSGGVADHTWTHPTLTALSPRELQSELGNTKQEIERTAGVRVDLMRPPFGARDTNTDRVTTRLGMVPVMWDVDTQDSAGAGSDLIAANADEGMRPGSIILMHDTYDRSLAALPRVLEAAKRKGMRFVSVPQLLALDPPSEAQVREGGDGCSDRERFREQEDATAMRLNGEPMTAPPAEAAATETDASGATGTATGEDPA